MNVQVDPLIEGHLAGISERRALEERARVLGLNEEDIDLTKLTEIIDDSNPSDEDLIKAIYPVTDIFESREPLQGIVYEDLKIGD